MGDDGTQQVEHAGAAQPAGEAPRVLALPLGAFSAVVLGLEVLQARICAYSVQVMVVYAVVGIAMLGFGASGTLVALRREWLQRERLPRVLAWSALAFAGSVVLAHAVFVRLTPLLRDVDVLALGVASLLTAPFLAAGTLITLALTSAGKGVARAYAANLVGSGAGCFLPLVLLGPLTGERLLGLLALLAWCAALPYVRAAGPLDGRLRAATLATFALCALSLAWPAAFFPIAPEPQPGGQLSGEYEYARKQGIRVEKRFDRWNPTGRIEIVQFHGVPGGPEPYNVMFYAQDSSAGSSLIKWDGRTRRQVRPSASEPGTFVSRMCSQTIYAQGYYRARPRVLVIGLGGGPDLQCALYNEARSIDVVEINRDSIAAVRGPFDRWLGGIGSDPRVRFHERDGRSFVRARVDPYDLIQLSGVDTKNLTASAGLALSENHLYTLEAFRDYLTRLSPDGAISIIRFGEIEAMRLAATAMAALRKLGATTPERHIAIGNVGFAYGVIVRKQPWTDSEAAALEALLRPHHFRGIDIYYYTRHGIRLDRPTVFDYLPSRASAGVIGTFFELSAASKLAEFAAHAPVDISPPTDERPFFFDLYRYNRIETWTTAPHVRALASMLGAILALSLLLILLPLRALRASSGRATSAAVPLLFASIGLGYVVLEIWLLHRFSMFLGHQAYSLSVVLSSLLVATGAGAALGERVLRDPGKRAWLGTLAVLGSLLVVTLLLDPVLDAAWDAGLPVRAACAIAFVAPLGLALGQPFAAALSWLRDHDPARVPWCIGINAFASVVASVGIVPLAMGAGYHGVLLTGAGLYALAALCASSLRRVESAPRAP
jgi:hypothetical protein